MDVTRIGLGSERARVTFEKVERTVLAARTAFGLQGGSAAIVRLAAADLEVEEIWASMRFANTPLDRAEVEALLRRGVAVGGHQLGAYIAVDDYAAGMRFVRDAPTPNRRRGFLTVEEIVEMHARIARRTSDRPGTLRATALRPLPGGIVPPPPWLIPQSLAAFVERLRAGPPADGSALAWIADAHARYERIHPFEHANGRVGRALVNLLLKRAGFLPFIVRPRDASKYLEALRAADSRNPWPLATMLARSLARSYALLASSLPDAGDVRPLSEFALGRDRASLYKAAQRGRLRAFRRDGRLYTTARWIAEYRARLT